MSYSNEEPMSLSNLPISAVFRLDVEAVAHQIETLCGDYLLIEPEGVYVISRLEPVMTPSQTYYTHTKKLDEIGGYCREPLQSIYCLEKEIFNDSDKQVMPKYYFNNKQKFVSRRCFLPYRGLKIMEILVKNAVSEFVQYERGPSNLLDKLQGQLQPIDNDWLEEITLAIKVAADVQLRQVSFFLGDNNWDMFSTKLDNGVIHIERHLDWRVFDWTQRMESGEWK